MRRLYRSHDRIEIDRLRERLQREGVDCLIRNDFLAGAAGELPPTECWPELWISDDEAWPKAQRLLADELAPVDAAAWRCAGCGETVEGGFGRCWRCGGPAPEAD